MWKDYSIGYIKMNRASSISVLAAAFISALFLSLLCGLFYNLWNYELEYHSINGPQDGSPSPLAAFYLFVLLLVSLSLILIIHNSFAVSMNARIHQFGIFSSIGATPRQIRTCLLQEAAMLCAIPVLLGSFVGIALTFGAIQAVNIIADGIAGRQEAVFSYHPLVFAAAILASLLTVLISAWLPARRLSRLTPLEAIKNTEEFQLKRRKSSPILTLLFGAEGELSGNALKAQSKALRTATLSLTLSFLGFALMLSFFTLSEISTNHTYFERYQDAWDVMAEIKDTRIEDLSNTKEIHALAGTDSLIYQKAHAFCLIQKDAVSKEVQSLGGLERLAGIDASTEVSGGGVSAEDGIYSIHAPIVILDDSSFAVYCDQIGVPSADNGSIVLNRIWDSMNSNFRYKEYIPFLSEDQASITLQSTEDPALTVTIPVLDFTKEPPVLREEYDNYALVQFVSLSTWKQIQGSIGSAEPYIYIRILSEKGRSLTELNDIETELANVLGHSITFEIENRVHEKLDNTAMLNGYKVVVGAF